ncbi:MAG: class II aldolase/adducin family protein [Myxococcaceae bacterium]
MELGLFEDIRDACAQLHARGLLAAADGNVSVRQADGSIVLTPAGVNKARLRPGSLARVTLDGRILEGRPSTERAMHLAVYRACPEARVIVHAHPPTAIAWTLARPDLTELPTDALPELLLAAGRVPIVPYARPGTEEMGAVLLPFLPAHRLLLLSRHGALAWGESLEEAVNGIERVEHSAIILKAAAELGGTTPLPESELQALRALKARIGPRLQ